MAYLGYLCFGGIEFNSAMAVHYGKTGWAPDTACVQDCCLCPGLDAALGYPDGYNTPAIDEAPWFDPTEPNSYDFGGMIIQSVEGLGPGPTSREQNERAGDGSRIGRRRQAGPTITVTGLLMGRTGCAVQYGIRWLRMALRGECGDGCVTSTLRYLECCPPELDEDCPDADPVEHFAPFWRELRRVALISDVEIVERIGKQCSCGCGGNPLTKVQFILAAERPCAYRDPVQVHEDVPLIEGAYQENCFTWVKLAPGEPCPPDEDTCVEPAPCAINPGCPSPPGPPSPPLPLDTCTTCTPFTQRSMCLDLPADIVPGWAEGVIGLQVYTGAQPIRHLNVRFYPNPLGLPPDELDPCTACSEVNVSHIPAWSNFEMDSASRSTTITCPGSAATSADSVLGGPPGQLFSYPTIDCGGVAYSACLSVDGETVAPDATIGLSVTVREC